MGWRSLLIRVPGESARDGRALAGADAAASAQAVGGLQAPHAGVVAPRDRPQRLAAAHRVAAPRAAGRGYAPLLGALALGDPALLGRALAGSGLRAREV